MTEKSCVIKQNVFQNSSIDWEKYNLKILIWSLMVIKNVQKLQSKL